MLIERKVADGAEFTTTTGICHVTRINRPYPRHAPTIVDFDLHVIIDKDHEVSLTACTSSDTYDGIKSLLGDSGLVSEFIIANRLKTFEFEVTTIRSYGVDKAIPFDDLRPEQTFTLLTRLARVDAHAGAVA